MNSKLSDQLITDSLRNVDLQRLMLMCRSEAQMIYVVCVGVGDAFINRYWPIFRRYVAQERLRLMLADEKPLGELAEENIQQAIKSGEEQAVESLGRYYKE